MKIRVGQIGNGGFGKKILNKLAVIDNVEIIWVSTSQDKWWKNQLELDWVIVCSPNEFHYEHSKYFLEKGINVFCEKPACFSYKETLHLFNLATKNNCLFYVDDVLYYENIKLKRTFLYKKWGKNYSNIVDRIAYHHFYLVFNEVQNQDYVIEITKNTESVKKFSLTFGKSKFSFNYDLNWYKKKEHNIILPSEKDALLTMLSLVLNKQADFNSNKERTLFATKVSEEVKEKLYGKAVVVGAGVYGITAAVKLADKGFKVDLFEANTEILASTSGINQYRVHRGYHYPRSKDTILSCKNNEKSFIKYYNQSLLDGITHYYSIADQDSKTTPKEYLKVLDECNLEWEVVDTLPGSLITIKVEEKLYCPEVLRSICWERLRGCGVNVVLSKKISDKDVLQEYKFKVFATYSSLNDFEESKKQYQYELCEKPIFLLPDQYKNKSIVVMDGPFMCFDPYSNTCFHVGGNVVHAIHSTSIGTEFKIPSVYRDYINNGIIYNPKFTNVSSFIESAKKFFPDIEKAKHIGSMYTVRTVLPNKDHTDERPTVVSFGKNYATVFSGKVVNCVEASEHIIKNL